MCDYSITNVKSRPATVGDKLRTTNFGTGTRGFAAPEDATTAVCVLPGTELAFASPISVFLNGYYIEAKQLEHKTAIFRQKERSAKAPPIPNALASGSGSWGMTSA